MFQEQAYYWLWSKIKPGTTVLDLGTNIGDTAIYFAMNHNVKKVMGYEANPKTQSIADRDLENNPFRPKIELYGMAVSDSTGRQSVGRGRAGDDGYSITDGRAGMEIPSIDINDLTKIPNTVIKADIEGSEHTIFTKRTDLRNVYALQIEYHRGMGNIPKVLIDKGFKVNTDVNPHSKDGKMGFIYAERD